MDTSAFDVPALLVGVGAALAITITLSVLARDGEWRKLWLTGAGLATVLTVVGLLDLLRESPRETHIATILVGVPIPVLAALGMQRAARRVRPWIRWVLVFVTALVLLFGGLLLGAAVVPRFLP